jgi:hypothetical protein
MNIAITVKSVPSSLSEIITVPPVDPQPVDHKTPFVFNKGDNVASG